MHSIRTARSVFAWPRRRTRRPPLAGRSSRRIFDLTGITCGTSAEPLAQGVRTACRGPRQRRDQRQKIRLVDVDYGYKIPEAVAAYKRMVGDDK